MRILFIVPYVPNLIRVRPYNLIRHLAARGHEVTVLTLWSSPEERADAKALKAHCDRVVAMPLPRYRSLWNCLHALSNSMPLQAAYCWSPSLAQEIARQVRQLSAIAHQPSAIGRRPDIVHVEHLRGATYGLRTKDLGLPTVWDSVDCISYLFEQAARDSRSAFGRLVTRLELGRTQRYEGWLIQQFDKVLVTSDTDRRALESLQASRIGHHASGLTHHSPRITVLPNGVDLAYFTPTHEPREADTLVFSGKMSYHANVTAALHLVQDIMPYVWEQRRHVRLIIAGKDPPGKVRALATRHWPLVKVTGTVPDIRPYLRQATVAALPTPYGAGIQNKVLEAMACGTPVVASPQAVSALQVTDSEEALVAREPAEFARRVLKLLEDQALRKRIGRNGRAYVEKYHDWGAIAEQLERTYQDAIAEHGSHS